MARRCSRSFALALPVLIGLLAAACTERATDGRPNVVFLLADDLGREDVGFMGGTEIATPNLDRLAASGARLDQLYALPVCSPTRAALLTGRYPMRYGMQLGALRPSSQAGLPITERTLAEALREEGYQTALCGKWHLGHADRAYLPTSRGFDHQYGSYNGGLHHFQHVRDGGFDWHRDDEECHDEGYTTHLLAAEAERLIREREKLRPFFLLVSFNAVHAPLQAPPEYKRPYAEMREPRRTYAGMVAAVDEAVGRIVAALDEQGLRESTLIVFASDNGGARPGTLSDNGPLRGGKGALYEGGVRVCALAAWEGRIAAGTIVAQPLHMVDWYPTLLKLAGGALEQELPLDGRDAWPTIARGAPSPHEEILVNCTPNSGAIRAGDWKLVLNGHFRDGGEEEPEDGTGTDGERPDGNGGSRVELFDLARDPGEANDLADECPELVSGMRARYEVLAAEAAPPKISPRVEGFEAPRVWGEGK